MLSQLKLAHRLWLAAALPLLVLGIVSHQYYREISVNGLEVSNKQREGMPVIRDLRKLFEIMQDERVM